MKKLVNCYSYRDIYDVVKDEDGKIEYLSHTTFLRAMHPNREYPTKIKVGDLPEYYCDLFIYDDRYNQVSAKGVVDVYYVWVPENHFMKDSRLHVSYRGKIKPYYDKFTYEGKEITSVFPSYTNEDYMVFGNNIFKFLAYVHKYSECDLSKVRREFVKQCRWLRKHEPLYAPRKKWYQTYGKWFDNKIKIENYDN